MSINDGALEMLLDRLPPDVAGSFSEAQRAALWQAIKPASWRRHPINIRLSFPLFSERYFVVLVGGAEKRSGDRLNREKRMFPFRTAGNILFLLGVGGAFYAAAVLGIFMFSNLIEF
ncbi:hypothetical protein [Magnetospirillum sp. UT-4]|uniref:hypothetical protein n=1 Tax=Magnetospirillum sp. UT-4 TaxID=2681467 RepID=UPI00137CAB78|nr:hypothetical protein [Magnetospirillum sp. UT-4]CAA7621989.1 conserved hypothetical protein [Magnetospirillum sp. UT-4]